MAAQFWSGHAHGWELAVWWVCIAAFLLAAVWARWWPSRRRRLAQAAADTARVLRERADAALLDGNNDRTEYPTDDPTMEVDAMSDKDTDDHTGTGDGTDGGTNEDQALRALTTLIREGAGTWRSTYGGPAVRIYLRPWPDNSVDNLTFADVHRAYGERVNHNGEPVWQLTGTVTEVVAALRELPAPDAPDAPRTILPRRDAADRDM